MYDRSEEIDVNNTKEDKQSFLQKIYETNPLFKPTPIDLIALVTMILIFKQTTKGTINPYFIVIIPLIVMIIGIQKRAISELEKRIQQLENINSERVN